MVSGINAGANMGDDVLYSGTVAAATEALAAAEGVGAVFHESLVDDLDIFYDKPTLARLAAVVREVGPEVILTHPPADYMEDHTNTCRLVVTAAFSRGMPNFPVDPPRVPTENPTGSRSYSARRAFVNPTRPCLLAQYDVP